jgi:hypothetical protein
MIKSKPLNLFLKKALIKVNIPHLNFPALSFFLPNFLQHLENPFVVLFVIASHKEFEHLQTNHSPWVNELIMLTLPGPLHILISRKQCGTAKQLHSLPSLAGQLANFIIAPIDLNIAPIWHFFDCSRKNQFFPLHHQDFLSSQPMEIVQNPIFLIMKENLMTLQTRIKFLPITCLLIKRSNQVVQWMELQIEAMVGLMQLPPIVAYALFHPYVKFRILLVFGVEVACSEG